MSWTKRVKHPKNILNVGDEIECQVLEVDAKAKRISLGVWVTLFLLLFTALAYLLKKEYWRDVK
jgi:hypothetical protein